MNRGVSRRAALRLLGATAVVVVAARGALRRLVQRRAVQVGGAEGPVIPVVPLDEDRIVAGDRLAG